jgi:hypothetical protein
MAPRAQRAVVTTGAATSSALVAAILATAALFQKPFADVMERPAPLTLLLFVASLVACSAIGALVFQRLPWPIAFVVAMIFGVGVSYLATSIAVWAPTVRSAPVRGVVDELQWFFYVTRSTGEILPRLVLGVPFGLLVALPPILARLVAKVHPDHFAGRALIACWIVVGLGAAIGQTAVAYAYAASDADAQAAWEIYVAGAEALHAVASITAGLGCVVGLWLHRRGREARELVISNERAARSAATMRALASIPVS